MLGEEITVRAEIATLQGVSGHADKNGLLRWLDGFTTKPHIFVNHGEHDQSMAFVETCRARYGVEVDCPYSGSEFDLLANRWTHVSEGVKFRKKTEQSAGQSAQQQAYNALLNAIEQLEKAAKSTRNFANSELKRFTEAVRRITNDIKN